MADMYAELEEPLFLEEPPDPPQRPVKRDAAFDAWLAFEEESCPAPVSGTILFTDAPPPQPRLRAPMLIPVFLAGLSAGFALMLMLLG